MIDKYNRSNFYDESVVDGVTELDFTSNKWSDFKMTRGATYYTITDKDLQRPDLVSFFNYRTTKYWWIISMVNNIDDWFNDLTIGDIILIPNKLDIEEHFVKSVIK